MSTADQLVQVATPTAARRPRRRFIYLRDLLLVLVFRDLKLRYEGSLLGFVWALLNPLTQLAVFVMLFGRVIQLDIPHYPLFVFIGVLAWNWTREGLLRAGVAITSNRELIRQPGFPLTLLPVVSLATPLIDLLVALPLLIIFLLASGGQITPRIFALPAVVALQFLLIQGLAYLVAASQVMFRDTSHVLGVTMMLGFYLTPVFYSIENVPPDMRAFFLLNPMAYLLGAYRWILMDTHPPSLWGLFALTVAGTLLCWLGRRVFLAASHRFAEEL